MRVFLSLSLSLLLLSLFLYGKSLIVRLKDHRAHAWKKGVFVVVVWKKNETKKKEENTRAIEEREECWCFPFLSCRERLRIFSWECVGGKLYPWPENRSPFAGVIDLLSHHLRFSCSIIVRHHNNDIHVGLNVRYLGLEIDRVEYILFLKLKIKWECKPCSWGHLKKSTIYPMLIVVRGLKRYQRAKATLLVTWI